MKFMKYLYLLVWSQMFKLLIMIVSEFRYNSLISKLFPMWFLIFVEFLFKILSLLFVKTIKYIVIQLFLFLNLLLLFNT